MKRKIIALFISIQMLAAIIPVYAEQPSVLYQYDEDKEILSLGFDTGDFADTVLTLTLKSSDGSYAAVKEVEVENGTAQVKLIIPQGSYDMKVKRQDTLEECKKELILTGQMRADIVEAAKKAISDKDFAALDKLAEDYSSFLGMVKTDGAGELMIAAGNDFKEADEFAALYNGFGVAAAINASVNSSAFETLLENEIMAKAVAMDSILPMIDGKNAYEYSSENVRSEIAEDICKRNDYAKLSDVTDAVVEKTLFVNLHIGDTEKLTKILNAYVSAGKVDAKWSDFSALSPVLQRTVIEGIKGKYNSFGDVGAAFKTQINKAKSKNNNTVSSSGGGGGGGTGVIRGFESQTSSTPAPSISKDNSDVPVPKYIFKDMEDAKWAYGAVECLYRRGVVNGVSDDKYEPRRLVTRAEFTKMIISLVNAGIPSGVKLPFKDISESDWAYPYVACAYQNDVVSGISADYFGAGEYVTREQAAVLIERLINKFDSKKPDPGLNVFIEFDDMDDAADWAKDSILYLLHISMIKGKENKNFKPKDSLTRAEAAMMLYSYLVVKGEEGK